MIKTKFIDEDKNSFSFWVYSFFFLKKILQSLDYKKAKIIKKKKIIFSEKDENKDKDKDFNSLLSESLDDKSSLDFELAQYEIRVSKNPFNLERIFDKSQKKFNPLLNNDNLENYMSDLNLSKKVDKKNFACNKNYLTYLKEIFGDNYNNYFYNEKSGLTLSLLQILEQYKDIFHLRY